WRRCSSMLSLCRAEAQKSRFFVASDGGRQGIWGDLYPLTRREMRRADDAGWSSPVARQAHNLKVLGSNPSPATSCTEQGPPATADPFAFWAAAIERTAV